MLLERSRTAQAKAQKIDLHDSYSVRHWAQAFGLSELDLAIAVQNAGPNPSDVAFLLKREPKSPASQA